MLGGWDTGVGNDWNVFWVITVGRASGEGVIVDPGKLEDGEIGAKSAGAEGSSGAESCDTEPGVILESGNDAATREIWGGTEEDRGGWRDSSKTDC